MLGVTQETLGTLADAQFESLTKHRLPEGACWLDMREVENDLVLEAMVKM